MKPKPVASFFVGSHYAPEGIALAITITDADGVTYSFVLDALAFSSALDQLTTTAAGMRAQLAAMGIHDDTPDSPRRPHG